ncbi:MAG: septal ring lytic transglycosylase RlpA family protein [Phaeodactylibacter sp.]|nr:septal ring lytic transglycosylase RlpA family protein [Phaeodactylibacter sp.]MCB9300790.1 septal ring lytic transglycosylase RlpA family protein [Lewinellaceae bacterium]HQU60357.1 septal ring lytic transglycosylase RlpA family protein [Saprospiraceae bacterium]
MKDLLSLLTFFLLLYPTLAPAQYYYSSTGNTPEYGIAVFYADYMQGRRTALEEVYRMDEYTCAHKTYPKGTLLKVTRLDNNQSVVVRVNDRGPYDSDVIVDLSRIAALDIGLVRDGRARVKLEVVGNSSSNPRPNTVKTATTYSNNGLTPRGGATSASPSNYNFTDSKPATSSSGPAITILPAQASGYAVQLGSYQSLDNANRQAQELQARGISNLHIWQKAGLSKVVVATFASKASAQSFLATLRSQYMMDGLVVLLR